MNKRIIAFICLICLAYFSYGQNDSTLRNLGFDRLTKFIALGEFHDENNSIVKFEIIENLLEFTQKDIVIFMEISPGYAFLINEYLRTGNKTIEYIKYQFPDEYNLFQKLNNLSKESKNRIYFYGIDRENKWSRENLNEFIRYLSNIYPSIRSTLGNLINSKSNRLTYNRIENFLEDSIRMNIMKNSLDITTYNVFQNELKAFIFGCNMSRKILKSRRKLYPIREDFLFNNIRSIISSNNDSAVYLAFLGRLHVVKSVTGMIGNKEWNSCINRLIESKTLLSSQIISVWIDYNGYFEVLGMKDIFIYKEDFKKKTTMKELQNEGIIDKTINYKPPF